VIELTPDNRYGYDSLGGLYHLMGRTDEAIVLLEKSLAIEPTAYAYSNIGTLYFFQGRYGDAVRVFEKASELEPKSYLVRGNLADAYRWAPDQREKSLAVYRQAIALARDQLRVNPRDPELNGDIALYWAKLGESQRALEAMRVARKEAPRDVNLLFESAVVFHLAGQDARALQMLESAAEAGYSLAEIRAEPELARLRAHPHYQALIQGSTAKPVASRSDPTRQK
jgi:tetratricopeptide (TPR) repeat protein